MHEDTSRTRAEARDRLRPYVNKARRFTGWSLDDVAPRPIGPGLPWDYTGSAAELLPRASIVLDMGTGGGELFADLCSGRRGRAVATESWRVNAPIARRRLSPLGVEVVRADSLRLPFRAGAFDVVLNRHEELNPAEVGRVLAPAGTVLTQQVGRNEWREVRPFFPRMQDFGPLFERYRSGFRNMGMEIARAEACDVRVVYRGVGELVYLLCLSPWSIPEFDPLGHDLAALVRLEERLRTPDGLVLTESRFLIEAVNPK